MTEKLFIIPPNSIPATNQPDQTRNVAAPSPTPNNPTTVEFPTVNSTPTELRINSAVTGTTINFGSGAAVIRPVNPPSVDTSGGWNSIFKSWAPGTAGDYVLSIHVALNVFLDTGGTESIQNLTLVVSDLTHPSTSYGPIVGSEFFNTTQNTFSCRFSGTTTLLNVPADAKLEFVIIKDYIQGFGGAVQVDHTIINMRSLV